MRILASSRNLTKEVGPFAVGLGIFDGVHLGHQALLNEVQTLATNDNIDKQLVSFYFIFEIPDKLKKNFWQK